MKWTRSGTGAVALTLVTVSSQPKGGGTGRVKCARVVEILQRATRFSSVLAVRDLDEEDLEEVVAPEAAVDLTHVEGSGRRRPSSPSTGEA